MSGYKSGVQQRLTALNSKSIFVNCDNHTLNLVGVRAASHEIVHVHLYFFYYLLGSPNSARCFCLVMLYTIWAPNKPPPKKKLSQKKTY